MSEVLQQYLLHSISLCMLPVILESFSEESWSEQVPADGAARRR